MEYLAIATPTVNKVVRSGLLGAELQLSGSCTFRGKVFGED